MKIRFEHSPKEVSRMNTEEIRASFLVEDVIQEGVIHLTYSHYDRVIIGGAKPMDVSLELPNEAELRADYFLERREMGIINVGGKGVVTADGKEYELEKLSCLYLGKGTQKVAFRSADSSTPAHFFFLSSPAHHTYEAQLFTKEQAIPMNLGAVETANERTVYKYIHADGIKSCQLVMGLTILKTGSVWNTMPAHTHTRRMEAYFYFDLPEAHRIVHLMGQPKETRHMFLANHQAIISPPWSIHSGCGTSNYSFIWGMAGENLNYADMDLAEAKDLL
jgi:4-deoxy-L-threo-5-hexosulose-uronate ketol-isomerase